MPHVSDIIYLSFSSLSIVISGPSMLLQMALFHSFEQLSNIPWYIGAVSSSSTHLSMVVGSFHVLAIVSSAAVDIGMHVSF